MKGMIGGNPISQSTNARKWQSLFNPVDMSRGRAKVVLGAIRILKMNDTITKSIYKTQEKLHWKNAKRLSGIR